MKPSTSGLVEQLARVQQQARDRDRPKRHGRMRATIAEGWPTTEPTTRTRAWTVATAAAVAAALVLAIGLTSRPGPLTFDVEAALVEESSSARLAAGDRNPMGVSFSDGSTLRLQPGADMRVRSLDEKGAVLRLDHGGVDVDIVPRSSSAWRIDAGPYRVEVTGTAFFVAWEPASQTFEVRMERGTVEVFGPQLPGARVLEAGDHLVVLGRGPPPALGVEEPPSTVAGNDGDDDRRGEEPEATTPTSAGAETTRASPPTRAQSGPQSEVSWRDLARRRHYAEAIARAEASGFSKLCDTLPSDALLELADAARYARRATLARHALVTLRRRFAGTADAAAAAFDLGRLASGDCTDGLAWFRTYLDERPRGSMAPEAKRRIGQCEDRQTTTADRH